MLRRSVKLDCRSDEKAKHLRRYPAYLHPAERLIVARWLFQHPGFRLARPADCGECGPQIKELRDGNGGPAPLA